MLIIFPCLLTPAGRFNIPLESPHAFTKIFGFIYLRLWKTGNKLARKKCKLPYSILFNRLVVSSDSLWVMLKMIKETFWLQLELKPLLPWGTLQKIQCLNVNKFVNYLKRSFSLITKCSQRQCTLFNSVNLSVWIYIWDYILLLHTEETPWWFSWYPGIYFFPCTVL